MKYLSLALIAIIIGLSWFLIRTPGDLSAEQHARLQEVLKQYLASYLKETIPQASEIQDAKVFTRVIEPGKKMQAEFKFFYVIPGDDGSANRIAREGNFNLTSENGNDWTAKMEKINDSYVEFSEALQISFAGTPSPDADKRDDAAAAPPAGAKPADKKQPEKAH